MQIRTKYNGWGEAIVVFVNGVNSWKLVHNDIKSISIPSHLGWYWTKNYGSYLLRDSDRDELLIIHGNWSTNPRLIETGRKIWSGLLEMGFELV
jgi:hypothetical protein